MRTRKSSATSTPVKLQRSAKQEPPRTPLKEVRKNSVSIPSLLTPERALELRGVMKAEGLGQQGRSRSAGENARAVLQLNRLLSPQSPLRLLKRSLSYNAVVKVVAAGEATTPDHIRQIHIRAVSNESLEPPEVKRIKRDDP